MLDFPNSPSVGQTFVSGGTTWTWDGAKWVASGSAGASSIYLPLTGGTLTGPLANSPITGGSRVGGTIDNAPIGQTTPAPGSFTALNASSLNGGPLSGHRNRIINGEFRIDQRNGGAGTTPVSGTYACDRWAYAGSQASKFTVQAAQANGPASLGFLACLTSVVAAAVALAAADFFYVYQPIEGTNLEDLCWGTAAAKPVTVSFLVYTSIAGTHSGSISNAAGNRAYAFTYNVPSTNTWTPVAVTIPGDTTGTWNKDNTVGAYLRFSLGCGATYLGAAGAWGSTNAVGATGAVQLVTTASAGFSVTGVQLEPGSIATPFERRLFGAEVELCKRYYQRFTAAGATAISFISYTSSNNFYQTPMPVSPTMRAAPTGALIGTWTTSNLVSFAISGSLPNLASMSMQATSAGGYIYAQSPANGGYDLSAEL
jgi:hypothetical protein